MTRRIAASPSGLRALVAGGLVLLAPLIWAQAPGVSVSAAALRLIEATPAGERGHGQR